LRPAATYPATSTSARRIDGGHQTPPYRQIDRNHKILADLSRLSCRAKKKKKLVVVDVLRTLVRWTRQKKKGCMGGEVRVTVRGLKIGGRRRCRSLIKAVATLLCCYCVVTVLHALWSGLCTGRCSRSWGIDRKKKASSFAA
jgi:hypothetical protein